MAKQNLTERKVKNRNHPVRTDIIRLRPHTGFSGKKVIGIATKQKGQSYPTTVWVALENINNAKPGKDIPLEIGMDVLRDLGASYQRKKGNSDANTQILSKEIFDEITPIVATKQVNEAAADMTELAPDDLDKVEVFIKELKNARRS
jgi:hypothetical protein